MDNILLYIILAASLVSALFSLITAINAGGKNKQAGYGQNFIEIYGEIQKLKELTNAAAKFYCDNLYGNMDRLNKVFSEKLTELERRIEEMTKNNEMRFNGMRDNLDLKLRLLQEKNSEELEKMRLIVDEKLNETLETRLSKSFELINSRLEAVYKGIGEMQGLAKGVGDLKKVLTNVKIRGTFGEIQLSMLLEQILSPEQYEASVIVNKLTSQRVDFAVKMPGRDDSFVYLPIDVKYPMEEYNRLIEASENCDKEGFDKCSKALETRILEEGKDISSKYIFPPVTTDFAVMYLPLEGLYAEAVKREGLIENLQRHRIMLCGPTTLGALLNSLQMGFKTLAIEKRSSELWQLLAAFKREFTKFTDILSHTQKKISEVSDTIEEAAKKTRMIQHKLSAVSDIGGGEAEKILYKADE